jgi:hypothetical protein
VQQVPVPLEQGEQVRGNSSRVVPTTRAAIRPNIAMEAAERRLKFIVDLRFGIGQYISTLPRVDVRGLAGWPNIP